MEGKLQPTPPAEQNSKITEHFQTLNLQSVCSSLAAQIASSSSSVHVDPSTLSRMLWRIQVFMDLHLGIMSKEENRFMPKIPSRLFRDFCVTGAAFKMATICNRYADHLLKLCDPLDFDVGKELCLELQRELKATGALSFPRIFFFFPK